MFERIRITHLRLLIKPMSSTCHNNLFPFTAPTFIHGTESQTPFLTRKWQPSLFASTCFIERMHIMFVVHLKMCAQLKRRVRITISLKQKQNIETNLEFSMALIQNNVGHNHNFQLYTGFRITSLV